MTFGRTARSVVLVATLLASTAIVHAQSSGGAGGRRWRGNSGQHSRHRGHRTERKHRRAAERRSRKPVSPGRGQQPDALRRRAAIGAGRRQQSDSVGRGAEFDARTGERLFDLAEFHQPARLHRRSDERSDRRQYGYAAHYGERARTRRSGQHGHGGDIRGHHRHVERAWNVDARRARAADNLLTSGRGEGVCVLRD